MAKRNPFNKPSRGSNWKFVILPRKTDRGWKAFQWLRKRHTAYGFWS